MSPELPGYPASALNAAGSTSPGGTMGRAGRNAPEPFHDNRTRKDVIHYA
ncbi:MAG: hypothetical protein GYA23_02035 [Methanomicrobiales archaeon]|nr:hypothetical protein [Methanomicrobiales archaeon]